MAVDTMSVRVNGTDKVGSSSPTATSEYVTLIVPPRGDCPVGPGKSTSCAWQSVLRTEGREAEIFVVVDEDDLNAHPDLDGRRIDLDNVGDQPGALFQRDQTDRQRVIERRHL